MRLIPYARLALNLLRNKKTREKEGLFVVEGEKIISEVLPNIKFVVYSEDSPILAKLSAAGIKSYKVAKDVMGKITSLETPPGILAVVEKKVQDKKNLFIKKTMLLAVYEVQDPGNLGTMIRLSDAVLADGMILSQNTVDLYNPKVIRATMGSIFRVPILQSKNFVEDLKDLRKSGIKLIGTGLSGKKVYWDIDLKQPFVLIVGNEAAGLSSEVFGLCDEIVKIPMPGSAESLNAAMAASIVLYEALRQKFMIKSYML